jgi:hypothetical protein
LRTRSSRTPAHSTPRSRRSILARERAEYRNPVPSHIPQPETFESRFDLFRWPEPPVRRLREFVLGWVPRVVPDLNSYTPEESARLVLKSDSWFHLTRRGGSFIAHSHPMASWSAVYCVRPSKETPARTDSGVLRFLDLRDHNTFLGAGNARLQPPHGFGHFSVRLTAGQLALFRSYLVEGVAPFFGSDARITVASNCWFGPRG